MRGNNFLPIDFGGSQKRIPSPNKNNRRVIHYSYNLLNNVSAEDLTKKDNSVQQVLNNSSSSLVKSHGTSTASQYDFYGKSLSAKRPVPGGPEQKLSLPSSKDATSHGLQGADSKPKLSDTTPSSLSRERIYSLNYSYETATNRSQRDNLHDLKKYSAYRSDDRSARYSDPLYEQRSLPPIPYRNPNNSESSTVNVACSTNVLDNLKISQMSKSQNNISTSGIATRKDGISAVENQDIMHAKMRKRGVCDQTDDSHYQRQFLRVLNKRF